ncbi:MAG: DEAD/DEAH box helicase [Pirellulaceae bacterium]|nr:DEAD/DEAH box helicase [Pirellulaceae bacterium]
MNDDSSLEELEAEGPAVSPFLALGLNVNLVKALEDSGYVTPTPIQAQSIPHLLAGRDLIGQAQTGTGKTAAFALPLLQTMDLSNPQTQVLVLTPTRELAIQVAEAFERYAGGVRAIRVAAIYGGQDYMVQFRQLDRGSHVVVGTPGRVMDHMRRGSLKLDGLRCLVLDEADEMLRMGFAEDVEWVLQSVPEKRQIALFSATLPDVIRKMAQQYLRKPAEITIQQRTATADTIRQRYVIAAPGQKEQALARLFEAEPIDGVIVFVKTKSTTEPLAEYLNQHGHRAVALNGDIPQKQRERIIENLRGGKINIVVATDVAARGLDVQRISHVINYDLPFDSEAYVHRIGRTGRAGRSGEAILFIGPRDRGKLRRLEIATRQKIEQMEFPTNRAINKQRVARFHERITGALSHPELETFLSIVSQYRQENDVPIEQIAAALAGMIQGKKPFLLRDEFKQPEFDAGRRDDRMSDRRGDRRDGYRDNYREGRRDDRGDRGDSRAPRGDRDMRARVGSSRSSRGTSGSFGNGQLETYRVEVGHAHQVKPGNIVGAIANEAGIDSAFIGRIEIFDRYSTVDLPQGMPSEVLESLGQTKIGGRSLRISRLADGDGRPARRPERSARPEKRKPGKRD